MGTLLAVCAMSAALLVGSAAGAVGTAEKGFRSPPAAASDAAAPSQLGTLELKSNPPGLEIVIDGNKTGVRTPGTVTLTAGQHQLTLLSPRPKDFKDRTLTITINAGKPTRLTLDLAPVSH